MHTAIPWNKCFWVGEAPKPRKIYEGERFFKLYWDKEKSKFISQEDYFALLLELYIYIFYNYLGNCFWNHSHDYVKIKLIF